MVYGGCGVCSQGQIGRIMEDLENYKCFLKTTTEVKGVEGGGKTERRVKGERVELVRLV